MLPVTLCLCCPCSQAEYIASQTAGVGLVVRSVGLLKGWYKFCSLLKGWRGCCIFMRQWVNADEVRSLRLERDWKKAGTVASSFAGLVRDKHF